MASWDELDDLMEEAEGLPYGPSRTAIVEEAVRIADVLGDVDAQYHVRMELVSSASFGGAAERALVAFTWCLKQFDKSPDEYDEYDLLWAFKWILGSLPDFANVPRSKIESVQNDFEARLKQFGHGLAPLYKLKCRISMDLGDVEATKYWYDEWKAAPYDTLQDCHACQINSEGHVLIFMGRPEDGLAHLKPVLSGSENCHSVPCTTYGAILEPLVGLGQEDKAREYHRIGYKSVASNPDFLSSVADHLVFAVHLGDTQQASQIFQQHLPRAIESMEDEVRREFLVAAWIFLEHLATVSDSPQSLAIPSSMGCYQHGDQYDARTIADWFHAEANRLVERFNERNGNDYYTKKLNRLAEFAGIRK